ncbi:hypothetical protein BDR04DRAFT_1139616 [Suillus decipiens]|nr:hypothetical protein BDR04DRAFT_1139616 [Suillus decipiens]
MTAKDTRPPYKVKSAGTKWGIPPDSPEDSTPTPALAEEQPAELKVKISRLESVEKDIPDKMGDKLLHKAASEGELGTRAVKPGGKEPLRKAKTMPVKATERGSQLEVYEEGYEITTGREFDSDDGWVHGEGSEEWAAKELEAGAAEAGMSTDDWIASEYGDDELWYPAELQQGVSDGMSKDDAEQWLRSSVRVGSEPHASVDLTQTEPTKSEYIYARSVYVHICNCKVQCGRKSNEHAESNRLTL